MEIYIHKRDIDIKKIFQIYINKIVRFLKSYILPDLPNQITNYVIKTDLIYLITSLKKQGEPSFLP